MANALNDSSDTCLLLPELQLEELFPSRRMSFLHKDEEDFNSKLIDQSHDSSASSNPSVAHHRLQLARFHYLKQQQLIKNQLCAARRAQGAAKGSRPLGFFSSSSSPPELKSQPSSGMRVVFLNPRKESAGTGVFLPRQHNEPRKKPACLTALLPARVVQALNLNLDELCFCSRAPSYGMGLAGSQKRSSGKNRSPCTAGAADRLPPEWSY